MATCLDTPVSDSLLLQCPDVMHVASGLYAVCLLMCVFLSGMGPHENRQLAFVEL